MSETINDIVREMRTLGRLDEKSTDKIPRSLQALGLRTYADRLEAAVKALEADRDNWRRQALDEDARANATHKDSLQVGNAAANHKALMEIQLICWKAGGVMEYAVACGIIKAKSRTALAKPPRNCDIMDWRTAWAKWRTELHTQKPCGYAEVVSGTKQFLDWYMSEARGEAK